MEGELNPLSAFKDKPEVFHCAKKNYLDEHAAVKPMTSKASASKGIDIKSGLQNALKGSLDKDVKRDIFMETQNGNDAVVEGLLSLWKITNQGQIVKDKEVSVLYKMDYHPTNDDEMKLTLSQDRSIITLGMCCPKKNLKIMVRAWNAKNLKPFNIPEALEANLASLPKGKLVDVRYVGKQSYMQVILQREEETLGVKRKFHHWFIFDAKSGIQKFEFHNQSEILRNP